MVIASSKKRVRVEKGMYCTVGLARTRTMTATSYGMAMAMEWLDRARRLAALGDAWTWRLSDGWTRLAWRPRAR